MNTTGSAAPRIFAKLGSVSGVLIGKVPVLHGMNGLLNGPHADRKAVGSGRGMRKVACPSRCTVPSGSVQLGEAVPARSIYELLRNSATAFDDRTALSFVHDADDLSTVERYRYRDLFAGCLRTANLLDALEPGVDEGHLGSASRLPRVPPTLWGGTTAGIVQPLNPLLSEEKLAALMNAAGSSVLIAWGSDADAPYWSRAQRLRELVPTLRHLVRVGPSGDDDADPSTGATIVDFAEATREQPDDRLVSNRRIEPEDIAGYFHTGGTTSEPKLARLSHGAIVFTAWTCVHLQGLTEGHVSINAYPLFHVAGALTTSLPSFSSGGEVVMPTSTLLRNWRVVQNYWKLFEHFRATELSVVPTGLAALVDVPLDGRTSRGCATAAPVRRRCRPSLPSASPGQPDAMSTNASECRAVRHGRGGSYRLLRGIVPALALMFGGISLALLPVIETPAIAVAVVSVGYGIASINFPLLNAGVSHICPPKQLAGTLGLLLALMAIGGLIAPYLTGVVMDAAPTAADGYATAFQIFGVTAVVTSIVALFAVNPDRMLGRFCSCRRQRRYAANGRSYSNSRKNIPL